MPCGIYRRAINLKGPHSLLLSIQAVSPFAPLPLFLYHANKGLQKDILICVGFFIRNCEKSLRKSEHFGTVTDVPGALDSRSMSLECIVETLKCFMNCAISVVFLRFA